MDMAVARRHFYEPESIFRDVRDRCAKARDEGERIDFLTFVPDGEPTLDVNLGREISLLRPLGVPVGVITNSSLVWRGDVREELALADWVSLKVDAVRPSDWRRINRPHGSLDLAAILGGAELFAGTFKGRLVTETMLVGGIDDAEDGLAETAEVLGRLRPETAYISIPTRPPAEAWVRPPVEGTLNRAYHIFAQKVPRVEYLIGYEGDAFAATGDVEKDLLSITAVHPMRRGAVEALLSRTGAAWSVVERLVARGDLTETSYEGHVFYLRRFRKAAGSGIPPAN